MNKRWQIRLTIQSDVQAIFSVLLISWLDTYVNEDLGITRQFILESQLKYLSYEFYETDCKFEYYKNTNDNLHVVAVDSKDIIVGFLHCRRSEDKQTLDGLYVLPEFKGTGLAYEFAERFNDWENNNMDTELGVCEYNTRAINFYKKLGFEPNGVKYKIRDKIPCIDMVKKNEEEKL